jgi:hypothetical protein
MTSHVRAGSDGSVGTTGQLGAVSSTVFSLTVDSAINPRPLIGSLVQSAAQYPPYIMDSAINPRLRGLQQSFVNELNFLRALRYSAGAPTLSRATWCSWWSVSVCVCVWD